MHELSVCRALMDELEAVADRHRSRRVVRIHLRVGPLSGIEPGELIKAIHRGDLARLTAIPGVGKKTSERIVLELKDRLPKVDHTPAPEGGAVEPSELRDDVLSALMNLGYHRPLAEKAVESAIKGRSGDFEQTLRQSLRELAR